MSTPYTLYIVVLQNVTDILKIMIFYILYVGNILVVPFSREHKWL